MTPILKIAITGHTSGLGESLFNHFRQKGYTVEGFSRSNGYDLSNSESYQRIMQKIKFFDVFINNAHFGWSQVELLFLAFELWKLQPKHIINISSNSSDGNKDFVHPYAVKKAALDKACEQLNAVKEAHCRVTNLRPGWMDTKRASKINVNNDPKISPYEVTTVIDWIIRLPKSLHISTMSMTARD